MMNSKNISGNKNPILKAATHFCKMNIYNSFLINPDTFRVPQYNISPFSTEWINKNHLLQQTSMPQSARNLPKQIWGEHHYTMSGKAAIAEILKQYALSSGDEVFITTTTGNTYISSCVTTEIEKFCSWRREITNRTKLIFVNHEFGTTHADMEKLCKIGLPIVEDRAMSMFSNDINGQTGRYGDFTIYSLPKFLPVQTGGIIQVNNPDAVQNPFSRDEVVEKYLKELVPHFLTEISSIVKQRWENYNLLSKLLNPLGFTEELNLSVDRDVPSVYMFSAKNINLAGLKAFMQKNGVESSIFYGREAFFIPVHQYLNQTDIKFIASLIQYYSYETQ